MNQARGSYQFKTFSIIYGLENAVFSLVHVGEWGYLIAMCLVLTVVGLAPNACVEWQ
jgi:hypothetical protein